MPYPNGADPDPPPRRRTGVPAPAPGPADHGALNPGYFLPITAGPFIAAIGLVAVGAREAAIAAFGLGVFFWLVIGAVIIGRLMLGGPLPGPFIPVLSVLLSPPLTAGVAWFAIHGGRIDAVQEVIADITVMMLLVQLVLLPDYLRLPFTTQQWAFTFPLAVMGNASIRSAGGLRFDGMADCRVDRAGHFDRPDPGHPRRDAARRGPPAPQPRSHQRAI